MIESMNSARVGQPSRAALLGVFLLLGVAGCSTPSGNVQVVDRNSESAPRQPVRSGEYQVQRGDTLYSIAFRFGWDWKALAAHNGIRAPFTIHPGQRIRLSGPTAASTARPPVTSSPTPTATPRPSQPPLVVTAPPTTSRPVTSPPATTPTPPGRPVAQPPAAIPPSVVTNPPVRSASGWAWPASGAIIGRFSSNGSLNKGIDLAGELGQPVLAASDGTVVYAGSGLRGYGELLIIKHSDTYVSAYGHNRRLLVQEGQQVKVGQRIAEMGSTGTDRVKLHFEIRRQGKPVDPLQYLPKR